MNETPKSVFHTRAARIIGLTITITVCVLAVVAALVYATDIFLILFLALLFGVFLTRVSGWIADRLPVPYLACVGAVTTAIVLTVATSMFYCGVAVESEFSEARKHIDAAAARIREFSERYPTVKAVLSSTPFLRSMVDEPDSPSNDPASTPEESADDPLTTAEHQSIRGTTQQVVSAVAGVFKTTFGLLINCLLIFFVGLYLAAAPESYRDGLVALFPVGHRDRVRDVLDQMGSTLWRWQFGQFLSMLITGIGATLILLALQVPMAVSLGVVTGLLTFIPNLGAIISTALAILFAIPQGTFTLVAVTIAMVVLQLVESYLLTPLIQEKQVSQPPALQIAFQAILGVLFGLLGAAAASPMLAVAKVGVEEVYIKDVLEAEPREGSDR